MLFRSLFAIFVSNTDAPRPDRADRVGRRIGPGPCSRIDGACSYLRIFTMAMSPRTMAAIFAEETQDEYRHRGEMGRWRCATGPMPTAKPPRRSPASRSPPNQIRGADPAGRRRQRLFSNQRTSHREGPDGDSTPDGRGATMALARPCADCRCLALLCRSGPADCGNPCEGLTIGSKLATN